jgi:O-antigen ligase
MDRESVSKENKELILNVFEIRLMYLISFLLGINVAFNVSVINISIVDLVFVVLFCTFIIKMIRYDKSLLFDKLSILLMIFIISALPSFLISQDKLVSLKEFFKLFYFFIFYIIVINVHMEEKEKRNIIRALIIGSLASVVVGFIQLVFGIGPASFKTVSGLIRIYSVYGQPNGFGTYLAALLPIAFVNYIDRRNFSNFIYFVSIDVALIFTFSRGSWISVCISIGLISLFLLTKDFKKHIKIVLMCFVLLSLFVPTYYFLNMKNNFNLATKQNAINAITVHNNDSKVMDIVQNTENNVQDDYSINQRIKLFQTALKILKYNPLIGIGPGMFPIYAKKYRVSGLTDDTNLIHNTLLQIWVEYGLMPLLIFIIFIVFIYYEYFFRNIVKNNDILKLGIIGGITSIFISSFGGWLFVDTIQVILVLYLVLIKI